jgi:hypothetical protein
MSFITQPDLFGHLDKPHQLSMIVCPDSEQTILSPRTNFCPDYEWAFIEIIWGSVTSQQVFIFHSLIVLLAEFCHFSSQFFQVENAQQLPKGLGRIWQN